jgi:hypothetical protein
MDDALPLAAMASWAVAYLFPVLWPLVERRWSQAALALVPLVATLVIAMASMGALSTAGSGVRDQANLSIFARAAPLAGSKFPVSLGAIKI